MGHGVCCVSPSMRRRLLFGLGLTAIATALMGASCLSPTLPLPPPDVESITPSAEPGVWFVSGSCAPGALVTVLNDETGQGAVFEDREESGHWSVKLVAEECDQAWASQERDGDSGSRANFTIEAFTLDGQDSSTCQ